MSPPPRSVRSSAGSWQVPSNRGIVIWAQQTAGVRDAIDALKRSVERIAARPCVLRWDGKPRGDIRLRIERTATTHPQGYRLSIGASGVDIQATTPAGIWNAVCTLRQIAAQSGHSWAGLKIEDRPDIAVRGFMLDISRDKVPTERELRRLIDWLSSIKINQLQLYFEHTFRYARHPQVWHNSSPLSAREIRRLDRYCKARHVELVPNQNSLGHMERWLKHPRYAPLAEATGPWRSPFGDIRTTKATLCPIDPRSASLVKGLFGELLPCFSSRLCNIGCDEPFELGQGRSKDAVRRRGEAAVFAKYVRELHHSIIARGRRVMCWADMIAANPKLLRMLPKDIVLLEWGYEADHPFERRCRAYARAGFDFYVCPGTSSWCSFAGRLDNALKNMRMAALAATRWNAAGYLITDWGDFGHRQYWPASIIPTLFGACAAWNVADSHERDATRAAAVNGFGGSPAMASAWEAAGNSYLASGVLLRNKTVSFRVMQSRLDDRKAIEGLDRRAVDRLQKAIDTISRLPADRSLEADELRATLRVLQHAVQRARLAQCIAAGEPPRNQSKRLADDISAIILQHSRLWRARNRPGGYRDSEARYRILLREYLTWSRLSGQTG